jgi:hypothetical protein
MELEMIIFAKLQNNHPRWASTSPINLSQQACEIDLWARN